MIPSKEAQAVWSKTFAEETDNFARNFRNVSTVTRNWTVNTGIGDSGGQVRVSSPFWPRSSRDFAVSVPLAKYAGICIARELDGVSPADAVNASAHVLRWDIRVALARHETPFVGLPVGAAVGLSAAAAFPRLAKMVGTRAGVFLACGTSFIATVYASEACQNYAFLSRLRRLTPDPNDRDVFKRVVWSTTIVGCTLPGSAALFDAIRNKVFDGE